MPINLPKSGLLLTAALIASTALSAPAMAQYFDGTYVGPVTSTTVVGDSTTETTGDSSVAPFENTTTTYTEETVTSTLAPANAVVSTTVNGVTYTGSVDYEGDGGQNQIHETSITNTYDPGPPPTVTGTIVNPDVITPVGDPVVTSVSAMGTIGNPDNFGAELWTSGPIDENGSVTATENSVVTSSGGVYIAQRVGTATYDPSAGEVVVSLPTVPTSFTSVTASGIATSGNLDVGGNVSVGGNISAAGQISAFGFDANGERVTNVGDAVVATDAVNLGQVNNMIAANNTVLGDLIDENRRRADAGTAVAVALSGATFLPNKTFNLTANIGGYRSQAAIAAQIGYLVNENIALNAGVAKGFSSRGATAWRGGFSVGF